MTGSFPNHIDVDNDREILTLARENPSLKIEVSSGGRILFSPLTGTGTGPKENEASAQLTAFARSAGGKVFSPSTGFRLPDNSLLGPDVAWVSRERLSALTAEDRRSAFWHLVPDVVIRSDVGVGRVAETPAEVAEISKERGRLRRCPRLRESYR